MTSARKKLWASYSKSKSERDTAAHCSWIKRTLAEVADARLGLLDCEYGTGTVWLGDSLVGSVTRDIPPGTESPDVILNTRDGTRGWINVKHLAREAGITEQAMRDGLEAQRR